MKKTGRQKKIEIINIYKIVALLLHESRFPLNVAGIRTDICKDRVALLLKKQDRKNWKNQA